MTDKAFKVHKRAVFSVHHTSHCVWFSFWYSYVQCLYRIFCKWIFLPA